VNYGPAWQARRSPKRQSDDSIGLAYYDRQSSSCVVHGRIASFRRTSATDRRRSNVTWLWGVDDFDSRLQFVRINSPVDFLTQLVRFVVTSVTRFLALVLSPADLVLRFAGKVLDRLVLGMLVLLIFTGIWFFLLWLPLMGMSRLWLGYPWARPILALPGALVAIAAHVFIMLVPDPKKDRNYPKMVGEWPLSWHLYNPPDAYYEGGPAAITHATSR
jgi:hypothetical protein